MSTCIVPRIHNPLTLPSGSAAGWSDRVIRDLDVVMAACDRLLADPPLRQLLGQAAAKEVEGRYTWEHNVTRVVELARSLILARRYGG